MKSRILLFVFVMALFVAVFALSIAPNMKVEANACTDGWFNHDGWLRPNGWLNHDGWLRPNGC
jgi:hypothetical protein